MDDIKYHHKDEVLRFFFLINGNYKYGIIESLSLSVKVSQVARIFSLGNTGLISSFLGSCQ